MSFLPDSLWASVPVLQTLSEVADELAYPAYVVGGWVRDWFLTGEAGKALDIVVLGHPTTFAEALSKKLGTTIAAEYQRFYVALVRWQEYEIEIVAARRESYSPESRNPHVEPATLEEDFFAAGLHHQCPLRRPSCCQARPAYRPFQGYPRPRPENHPNAHRPCTHF